MPEIIGVDPATEGEQVARLKTFKQNRDHDLAHYDVMGSKHLGADMNFAWPTAEVAVMGAEGAVNIIYRRELAGTNDPVSRRSQKVDEYKAPFANPHIAAERGYIDDVIIPHETRRKLIEALRMLETKRQPGPRRKHGNIPL